MKNFIFTTLLLTVSLCAATASYAHDVEIDGIYYEINRTDKTASVTYKGDNYDAYDEYQGSVVIPSRITISGNAYSVKSINNHAFRNCTSLTNVEIPNSVTSIEAYAFYGCTSLTNIHIPDKVTIIKSYAFAGCRGLKSIYLPPSLTTIGNNAFASCENLTSLYIPNSVTKIEARAFEGCTSLSSIYIPNSVSSIQNYAFRSCTSLTTIDLPNSLTEIPSGLFAGCFELTTVNIPNSIRKIKEHAFSNCSKLTNIILPDFITYLGEYAFQYCSSLKEIVIPNTLTIIESRVFYDCHLTPLCFTNELSLQEYSLKGLDSTSTIIAPAAMIPSIKKQFSGHVQSCPYFVNIRSTYLQEIKFSITDYSHLYRTYGNFELTKVCVSDKEIDSDKDGIYTIGNLQPGETYPCKVYFKENGRDTIHSINIRTSDPTIQILPEAYSSTYSTITIDDIYADSDPTTQNIETGVQINGQNYKKENNLPLKIGDLDPNTTYTVTPYAIYNGKICYGINSKIKTSQLKVSIENPSVHATTFSCTGVYEAGDAIITEENLIISSTSENTSAVIHNSGHQVYLTGLTPNSSYSVRYFVKFPSGKRANSSTCNFTTLPLEIEHLAPKTVSSSAAIAHARTNMTDEETAVWFEWRKESDSGEEATDSCKGFLYEGEMEGRLHNLIAGTNYQVRPYYESAAGKRYYGEWIKFNTNNPVYSDPTVHTYDNASVCENSVTLNGYIMAGTDEITEQGFEYYATDAQGHSSSPAEVLLAEGNRITATIYGLTFGVTYRFRAYAKSRQKTTYGEEREFTILPTSGTGQILIEPNPHPEITVRNLFAQSRIEIFVNGNANSCRRITLFNLNGQPTATKENVPDGHWCSIPTTALPAGLYILQVENTAKPIKLFLGK